MLDQSKTELRPLRLLRDGLPARMRWAPGLSVLTPFSPSVTASSLGGTLARTGDGDGGPGKSRKSLEAVQI